MSTQPQKPSTFKIAMLGSDDSVERELPQVMGTIARAARAAKAALAKFDLGEIEIWPPGKYPLLGLEAASLAAAVLEAVESDEQRRCPIVRKLIDNAIAYHAHLHWVKVTREEHARKVDERGTVRPSVWKGRAA